MTMMTTHWFEYGEPLDGDRVEATLRQTYATGPNESRDDDVTKGTVGIEALGMMDNNEEVREHIHEDESVMLSGLSEDTRERFLSTFEETDTDALMADESFGLNTILDELRDVHGEPVAENENMIVFADSYGNELNEIAANTEGVDRDDVSEWMHRMARKLADTDERGDMWANVDPVVVLKWNEGENPYLNEGN